MPDVPSLIQQGASNLWLFIPSAILLGALHGLEPGHSKTMMAAFIIAIRGTLAQAILLGLSATISHTAVVWLIAMGGLYIGAEFYDKIYESYLQITSAVLIVAVAIWMINRTRVSHTSHHHEHSNHNPHDHNHHRHHTQSNTSDPFYSDDHEREHAEQIKKRFINESATTGQIILFGLTGGLIPCPASITVLLLCLQFKQIVLGATLVLSFGVGLALTMVSVGAAAAIGMGQVSKRWDGLNKLAANAPYLSGVLIILVGLYSGYLGVVGLF